jgi:hypothetical protein
MKKTVRAVEPAQEFTAARFRQITSELQRILQTFEEFANVIEAAPKKTAALHNAKSINRAFEALVSSQRAIDDALRRIRLGDPIKVGELKPRSPARSAAYVKTVAEPKKPYGKRGPS